MTKFRINKLIFFVIFLLTSSLILSACSPKTQILGEWEAVASTDPNIVIADKMEFYRDGTFLLRSNMGLNLAGDYEFLDDNTMRVEFSGLLALAGSQIWDIRISKGILSINYIGYVLEFKRVK